MKKSRQLLAAFFRQIKRSFCEAKTSFIQR